jgi:hypothetical protein
MATQALTATPVLVSLEPGTPVWFTNTNGSAATVLIGFTSAGAATGPVVASLAASTGTLAWAWPGVFINYGLSPLYLVASVASGVTLFYPT